MEDSQTLDWLLDSLKQARLSLQNAELVLRHAIGKGESVPDIIRLVNAHAVGIRGLECVVISRRNSDD